MEPARVHPVHAWRFGMTDEYSIQKTRLVLAERELVALRAELSRVNGENTILAKLNTEFADRIIEIEKRIAELEAALKFYATLDNWRTDGLSYDPVSKIDRDCGQIARETLSSC
jgi:hypothetical protein